MKGGAMKKIPLTKGQFALVDDEDFGYLSRFVWHCGYGRAFRVIKVWEKEKAEKFKHYHIDMADMIINTPSGKATIIHLNKNPLDYRKTNLRAMAWSYSRHNKVGSAKNKSSIYRGVGFRKGIRDTTKQWRMNIEKDHKHYWSYHSSEVEAAKAYNRKAKELYGEYAYQNIINEQSNEQ